MSAQFLGIIAALIASAAGVVLAGIVLARSGDVIAARTRLGGLWVGSVFLAVATSLPELATDVSAVRLGVPDLAAGDLFGSSMANMLILALVGLSPRAELFRRAALDHGLFAALAIVLVCIAAVSLLVRIPWSVLGVGPGSIVLLVVYLAGTRLVFRQSAVAREAVATAEVAEGAAAPVESTTAAGSLRSALIRFALAAAVIVIAAPIFASSADRLAEATGLAESFVGTWLVGFATSLPELAASLAAVRIGANDLAIGNLFGSNAVNMVMFVPLDAVHAGGPILAAVSPVHTITALVAVILMAIAFAAILYRAKGRTALLEPVSLLMFVVYALGLLLVFIRSEA